MQEVSRIFRCPRGHEFEAKDTPEECPACTAPNNPFMTDGTTLKDDWVAFVCSECGGQDYTNRLVVLDRCSDCGGPDPYSETPWKDDAAAPQKVMEVGSRD